MIWQERILFAVGRQMLARWIRSMAGPHWVALFGLVLASWTVLYLMAVPPELRELSRIYGAEIWEQLCLVTPDAAGASKLWFMWVIMSAAMMLPTALPAFAAFDDLPTSQGDFGRLIAGYLAVWLGFSALAAGLQLGLFKLGLVDPAGLSLSSVLSGGLLIGAGLYQFSALKEGCLSKCRAPLAFFMEHWADGPWKLGLRLGAVCIGCCWALMLLAFVGGVMSLAFMGLATLLMIFEKLPEVGRHLTKPLGIALVGFGVWTLLA